MLPSNKQISQSHAGKFEITLKRGFGEKGGGGARKGVRGGGGRSSSTSLFNWGVKRFLKSFTAAFFF